MEARYYTVVNNINLATFEAKIQKLLSEGWELYGDLVISKNEYYECDEYFQAMVAKD